MTDSNRECRRERARKELEGKRKRERGRGGVKDQLDSSVGP